MISQTTGQLVVVKNGAEWCPPCKALGPILEDLAKKNALVVFISVDVDQFCPFESIEGIPDTRFIKDG